MLNEGQKKGLSFVKTWYYSPQKSMILEGKGGTGKSFLINEIVKELNVPTLLLAPTHEAVANLKDKVKGDYEFRTCDNALGIRPTISEKDIDFKHVKFPDIWGKMSLAIIDESSMLSDWKLKLCDLTEVKLLYVGHRSQLPFVEKNRPITDPCISPVFEKGYPIITLTEPMRNFGPLWDFLLEVEDSIYTGKKILKTPFDVSREEMKNYVKSSQGQKELRDGRTKFVLWTNNGVIDYNKKIRSVLWPDKYNVQKYVKGDRIILTSPLSLGFDRSNLNLSSFKKEVSAKREVLYTNTKGLVLQDSRVVDIPIDYRLTISCYEIYFECLEGRFTMYEPVNSEDYGNIFRYLERLAWACSTVEARTKAYKVAHFALSCFAKLHHYYAATAHRLQGSTVENIVYIDPDVRKNPNPVERAKCRYVGCSRTSNILRYYHG